MIGTCGQIGTELTAALREQHGLENVIAADIYFQVPGVRNYVQLDVLDRTKLEKLVKECGVTQIYLLAAMLSANGEKNKEAAWKLNMQSLLSVLEAAREQQLDKVFWPSSIAVFGPDSPRYNCPQETRIELKTVYGISKGTGECCCNYYFEQYGVDVRSLRYLGLIPYTAPAWGGTTDYAVVIFQQALEKQHCTCFLEEDTCLPMMYMPDAIMAALELMNAPKEKITVRISYNRAGMSFAFCDLAAEIKTYIPGFKISYAPDARQAIADSWPASIKDKQAWSDWGWHPIYNLKSMAKDMLQNLNKLKGSARLEKEMIDASYHDFMMEG